MAIVNASVKQQRNQPDTPATPQRPSDGGIPYDKREGLAEVRAAMAQPGVHRQPSGGAK